MSGSKRYIASAELGYETSTLDSEGNVTRTAPFDHVTVDGIKDVLPSFTGTISQIPPLFSAIRKDGKKLYEKAREGVKEENVEIDAREVVVHTLELVDPESTKLPKFSIDVECGGGTYIRSLVRDIGKALNSAANIVGLERTQQAQFSLEDCLPREEWTAENIYKAIDNVNLRRSKEEK